MISLRECSPVDGTSAADPARAEPGEIALLAGLVAVGLVPFARLALGGRFSGARLALGAAVALLNGAQLVRDLLRPPAGGPRHGRPVPRPHLVLLRGHLRPGVAPGPLVRGRR